MTEMAPAGLWLDVAGRSDQLTADRAEYEQRPTYHLAVAIQQSREKLAVAVDAVRKTFRVIEGGASIREAEMCRREKEGRLT